MGLVNDWLYQFIDKQINVHGIVIWYDPEALYLGFVGDLCIPDARVLRYGGSFFALRHEIDAFLDQEAPPRLMVYVPLDPADSHNALAEVESAGVILKPGQQPPSRNTRLGVIARNALKPVLGEGKMAEIEKQIEAGKLTLADLDKMDSGIQGVLSIIFGTDDFREIALRFLSSDRYDAGIVAKDALVELGALLGDAYEVSLPEQETPDAYRRRFARHLLATELVHKLRDDVPGALAAVPVATGGAARGACGALAQAWRLRRDLWASYVEHAQRVGTELALAKLASEWGQVTDVETFPEIEEALLLATEQTLLDHSTEDVVEMALARQSGFWAEQSLPVRSEWALAAVAGNVLLTARQVEDEVASISSFKGMVEAYTRSEAPWCQLDTYHRQMERRCHEFDFVLGKRHRVLEQLVSRARQRYMDVGSKLAERFVHHYHESKFKLGGLDRQTQIFEKRVKPSLSEGKTAYVWVDALRYEMARELSQTLVKTFDVDIRPAVAAVPTITEIGMAALLPQVQDTGRVIQAGESRLVIEIDGVTIKERKDRVDFLRSHAGVRVTDMKLEGLLPRPKKKVQQSIREAVLVLVTSQEIDSLCEGDNVLLARTVMDQVLHDLSRAFRILAKLGVQTIIVTADHGYLFGEEIGVEMKIDAPGGDTADLHRRVWVGHGGTANDAYLRANVSDFGLQSDLELATPWNFACFKVKGGARAYFHGGLSPQELIIPVMVLRPKTQVEETVTGELAWTLVKGSEKVSTRFFSAQVEGRTVGLFGVSPPKVRVEIRAGGRVISQPISASYGFENATGDVQLGLKQDQSKEIEPNTVTLMITEEVPQQTVTLHLLDVETGTELARIEDIEIDISI